MRIITASEFGTPDVLRVEERPVPKPGPDEVVVEVKAAGLNLTDTYLRRGMIESAPLPLTFGLDGAGVVVAVGKESTVNVGDRVAWERVPGSYAEYMAVPNESVIPLSPDVTFETAAGGLMQGLTAHYLCYTLLTVPEDAVALVHSAASGVGRMLTQLIKRQGGRVIATVSRGHKARSAVEAGAWKVLVRDEVEDLAGAIRDLTNGEGVDIVFDGTGKTLFDVSISSLHSGGTFVYYGRAGGRIPPIDLWEQPDGVRLVHSTGKGAQETVDQWRDRSLQVMKLIGDGTLDVLIDRTYPLEDAARAHSDLESQETVGKLLLLP